MLAYSPSKDFCKDSLTLNEEIEQRRFQRYYRVLGPQPRIFEQSSSLNGVGKFLKEENFLPPIWNRNRALLHRKLFEEEEIGLAKECRSTKEIADGMYQCEVGLFLF